MFYDMPEEGMGSSLTVRSADAIDATLTDYSNGLPGVPGTNVKPRPPEFDARALRLPRSDSRE